LSGISSVRTAPSHRRSARCGLRPRLRVVVLCTLAFLARTTAAATLVVGPGAPFARIADAALQARDGDVVEILPGTYRGDVAVWTQRRLTIRGVGAMPVLAADGKSAEGKAIWVFRDGDFDVSNIAMEGARVDDRNGAGIRFERGRLRVRGCRFTDNENGILTGNIEGSELIVEDSEFSAAPRDRGPLKHLLYVGAITRFTLSGSRFHQGFEGHLVKSRARENQIRYNLLYDGAGGKAAYELEFPNGGIAFVIGNVIGQSSETTNPTVVSFGAEGNAWPDSALYLAHNTLISDHLQGAVFVRVWDTKLPPATDVLAVNNLTVGPGVMSLGTSAAYSGNYPILAWGLGDTGMLDFRLGAGSLLRGVVSAAPKVRGQSLMPAAEFRLPVGTTPLDAPATWTPGAFQTPGPRR